MFSALTSNPSSRTTDKGKNTREHTIAIIANNSSNSDFITPDEFTAGFEITGFFFSTDFLKYNLSFSVTKYPNCFILYPIKLN